MYLKLIQTNKSKQPPPRFLCHHILWTMSALVVNYTSLCGFTMKVTKFPIDVRLKIGR